MGHSVECVVRYQLKNIWRSQEEMQESVFDDYRHGVHILLKDLENRSGCSLNVVCILQESSKDCHLSLASTQLLLVVQTVSIQ